MKNFRSNIFFLSVIILLFAFSYYNLSYIFHGIRCTYLRGETSAQIDDHVFFSNREVFSSFKKGHPNGSDYTNFILNERLDSLLEKTQTVAFLVLQKDSVRLEKYWEPGGEEVLSNSFSVAKSIVSLLVGCAIEDGYIDSVDQNVSDFIPGLKLYKDSVEVKIKHLLEMSSGLDWLENYKRPISVTAKAYYGTDIESLILSQNFISPPGEVYEYKSGDTQLLGLVLEKAVGTTVSDYASHALWSKIGAENSALWTLDHKNGKEKTFCCFNSTARDFLKIGSLVLNRGVVGEDTVVNPLFVDWLLTLPDLTNGDKKSLGYKKKLDYYSNSWWLAKVLGLEVFYARGFLGQYVVVVPEIDLVFVRLGMFEKAESASKNDFMLTNNLKFFIEEVIKDFSL